MLGFICPVTPNRLDLRRQTTFSVCACPQYCLWIPAGNLLWDSKWSVSTSQTTVASACWVCFSWPHRVHSNYYSVRMLTKERKYGKEIFGQCICIYELHSKIYFKYRVYLTNMRLLALSKCICIFIFCMGFTWQVGTGQGQNCSYYTATYSHCNALKPISSLFRNEIDHFF